MEGKMMQTFLVSTLTLIQLDGLRCVKSRKFYGTGNASKLWTPYQCYVIQQCSYDPVT